MSEDIAYRGTVHPWHCDFFGHMNVTWYVSKFDEAMWHVFGRLGLDRGYFEREQRGMAGVHMEITYHRELFAGDLVSVRARVLELGERSVRMSLVMHNDGTGQPAATMLLKAVQLDRRTRKSCAFEADTRARAVPLVGAEPEEPPSRI